MDLSALVPGVLTGTYIDFDRSSLDDDRPRMVKIFDTGRT
jgi:hypothetical protein